MRLGLKNYRIEKKDGARDPRKKTSTSLQNYPSIPSAERRGGTCGHQLDGRLWVDKSENNPATRSPAAVKMWDRDICTKTRGAKRKFRISEAASLREREKKSPGLPGTPKKTFCCRGRLLRNHELHKFCVLQAPIRSNQIHPRSCGLGHELLPLLIAVLCPLSAIFLFSYRHHLRL